MGDSYADWRERLAQGINQRLYPVEYLDSELEAERFHFMATKAAAIVIELKRYPSGLVALHFLVAAGDKREIRDTLRPRAEAWGKAGGAEISLVESREGWVRELKSDGYEVFQTSIAKEL